MRYFNSYLDDDNDSHVVHEGRNSEYFSRFRILSYETSHLFDLDDFIDIIASFYSCCYSTFYEDDVSSIYFILYFDALLNLMFRNKVYRYSN